MKNNAITPFMAFWEYYGYPYPRCFHISEQYKKHYKDPCVETRKKTVLCSIGKMCPKYILRILWEPWDKTKDAMDWWNYKRGR